MLAFVLGTRAEIIKCTPVIKACKEQRIPYFLIHTGQHQGPLFSDDFFTEFELSPPRYNLMVGPREGTVQTAQIILGLAKVLRARKPKTVLVQGDTNSALAGALAAVKSKTDRLVHLEAGLRNYNRKLPEEINRVLIDHCSDLLFTSTPVASSNLKREDIMSRRIFQVGNTIADMVKTYSRKTVEIGNEEYLVVTLHRQENIDDKRVLTNIFNGLRLVHEHFNLPLIYPVHPRAGRNIGLFGIDTGETHLVDPIGYVEFLSLLSNANMVLTDSGGVQEEACILDVPCVTLRDCTERPETTILDANIVAGTLPESILHCSKEMIDHKGWKHPYGDGETGRRVTEILGSIVNG